MPSPISVFLLVFFGVSLSLPVAIVFCLSLFHNRFPFSHSFTLFPFCLCPRVHRGHQTMAAIQPLHTSCADWHHRDGGAHVVPCCYCCCWGHLRGRDNGQLEHSTKCTSRLHLYLPICLWLSVLNLQQCAQDSKEEDLINTAAVAAEFQHLDQIFIRPILLWKSCWLFSLCIFSREI